MAEQEELDQLAEAEYLRLQRQNRQLKNELNLIFTERNQQLSKQKKIISLLEQEHNQLKSDIELLQSGVHAKRETEDEKKLQNLISQYEGMLKLIEEEKTNLWELEGHIKKIQKEIDALRNNEITDNCYKESLTKMKNDVVKLENRLDIINKKCSDLLTENAKLRESIDHMLQDRAHFNDLWQSMVTQFNNGKKYIMEIIDQSTIAYDQREELCNKLQTLKDKNEADKLLHIQEMRELQRKLEHDAKLQQFYNVKGQKRANIELEARETNKKLQQIEEFEKQLEEYNKIIAEIQEITGQNDIGKLAAQYTKQEEENFALFNYVNELSHEVEVLNETVQKLEDEIEKQKIDQVENEVKRQTETVEHLEKERTLIYLKAKESKENCNVQEAKLNYLLHGIEKIFSLIRCDDAPILNVLGTKNFLTIHNVQLFLGVIQKRINVLVNDKNTENEENVSSLSLSQTTERKDKISNFKLKDKTVN